MHSLNLGVKELKMPNVTGSHLTPKKRQQKFDFTLG